MLQVFRTNNISAYVALLLLAFVGKLRFLLHPDLIQIDSYAFRGLFFNMYGLQTFMETHRGWYLFLSVLVHFAFALYLNASVIRQKMYAQKNHFTALCFLLITGFLPQFTYFSGAFLANFFLLVAFSTVLQVSHVSLPRRSCFNIGLLIGLAVCFYFPAILFLPVFLLFVWLLRPFVLQELVAGLLGFLTPFYFAAGLLYLQGKKLALSAQLHFQLSLPAKLTDRTPTLIFAAVCVLMLIYSLYVSGQYSFKQAILVKKKWRLVNAYLFFALVSVIFSPVFPHTYLIVALTPFCILLSQSMHNRKENMNIFTFFFLLLSLLCTQWIFLK